MISSSLVSSRTYSLLFLCASRLCLSSTLLVSRLYPMAPLTLLRLPLVLLWAPPSHLRVLLVVHEEVREVQLQVGCLLSSSSASGVSTTARRFSSDQPCSASRRTLLRVYNSIVRSDQLLVCEVAFAKPQSRFPSVSQLRRGIPRSFSYLCNVSKHRFAELQQLSTIRTTHGSIEWGLYIVSPNELRCMSNNPFHQCTVSGRSVRCAVLKCCQHCAHLSLQLFLTVFHCSIALM